MQGRLAGFDSQSVHQSQEDIMDEPGLRCFRCHYRHFEVRPVPTADGSEKYECLNRALCKQRQKWKKFASKYKKPS